MNSSISEKLMKRYALIAILCLMWAFMIIKTILTPGGVGDVNAQYYGIMLDNTWQAHFNTDLLIHTIVFACWIIYREKSKVTGILYGLLSVNLGAIFTILYLIITLIKSKGDSTLFFKGRHSSFD